MFCVCHNMLSRYADLIYCLMFGLWWEMEPENNIYLVLSFFSSYFSFIAFLHFITAAKVYVPLIEASDLYITQFPMQLPVQ